MNERFFSLPEERQQAIINAGYRVFSRNTYKNSPMSEIAQAAGISKSLLFHYFHNKKELYLFLWDKCAQITIELTRASSMIYAGSFTGLIICRTYVGNHSHCKLMCITAMSCP